MAASFAAWPARPCTLPAARPRSDRWGRVSGILPPRSAPACTEGTAGSTSRADAARVLECLPGVIPAVLVALLLGVAAVAAPEAPQDQAAICQRHNGPVACRVW
jgi:hypothetical protein